MKKYHLASSFLLMLFQTAELFAQSPVKSLRSSTRISDVSAKSNFSTSRPLFYQYGIAEAFIGGLYEGQLTVGELKQLGDFGIGAPNFIDGELTMVDGRAYQSNAKGQTFEAHDELKSPFVFVTTFNSETVQLLSEVPNIADLFTRIEALLPNPNGMYAIRIKGTFSKMSTRAFPAVNQKPYKPLAELLDQQHFYDYLDIKGEMIGFYMPGYLSGINITGPHFHFLSMDRTAGCTLACSTAQLIF
jgi:acetolactate decarboxylase